MNKTRSPESLETLDRESLSELQLSRFRSGLERLLASNPFYSSKLREVGIESGSEVRSSKDYANLPFTTKSELSADQISNPPYGSNLTEALDRYTRIHQTSGTKGEPLRWLDTEDSWNWVARCWNDVYRAAGVTSSDRIFFAFSFGPFLGFWSAHESARLLGALSIPGGGMSSLQRIEAIMTHQATVLICTPTYALHLAEVAEHEGIDLRDSPITRTIQAGEPGASLASTKARIEESWGARCFDHAGATEVGPWGYECQSQAGLHINEAEYVTEVIDPLSGEPSDEGELVITNLGRTAMPVIRYRTGDRVHLDRKLCSCGRSYHRLSHGIIGRVDDVLVVRGVNIYPSSIENLVRRRAEVGEFTVDVYRRGQLDQMEIRIEARGAGEDLSDALSRELRVALGLRVEVSLVPFGSLPRFDLKARRFTDHRHDLA